MTRTVLSEWLDELPPRAPEALRSRRDLVRINRWLAHVGMFRRLWKEAGAEHWARRIVDLGGGDGAFLLRFIRAITPLPQGFEAMLVDRADLLTSKIQMQFRNSGVEVNVAASDVFDWLQLPHPSEGTFMIANLFLHHFSDESLRRLFTLIASRCQAFAACEPRRSSHALWATRLLWLLGCNYVTRHDARLSVQAGFRNRELPALWPESKSWRLREGPAGLFSHFFVAVRE